MARNYKYSKSNPHSRNEWFAATRAAGLSGLSMAMVNYLSRTGVVEPSCSCKRGHGSKRHYSFADLIALRLIGKLSQAGVSPLRLRAAIQGLRRLHPKITLTSLPASHLITNGQEIYLRTKGNPIERAMDGQFAFAFVIELSQIQGEIASQLATEALPKRRKVRRAA